MTDNMKAFIAANKRSPIVYGNAVTSNERSIMTKDDVIFGVRYRLKNGKQFLVTGDDKNSRPDYEPAWYIVGIK